MKEILTAITAMAVGLVLAGAGFSAGYARGMEEGLEFSTIEELDDAMSADPYTVSMNEQELAFWSAIKTRPEYRQAVGY